jgi:hypothetical protein
MARQCHGAHHRGTAPTIAVSPGGLVHSRVIVFRSAGPASRLILNHRQAKRDKISAHWGTETKQQSRPKQTDPCIESSGP